MLQDWLLVRIYFEFRSTLTNEIANSWYFFEAKCGLKSVVHCTSHQLCWFHSSTRSSDRVIHITFDVILVQGNNLGGTHPTLDKSHIPNYVLLQDMWICGFK